MALDLRVERGRTVLMGQQNIQSFLRMILHKLLSFAGRVHEFAVVVLGFLKPLLTGNQHQLVIIRHSEGCRVDGSNRMVLLVQYQLLVIDEAADNSVNTACSNGRNQVKADIDHRNRLRITAVMLHHGPQHSFIEWNGGVTCGFTGKLLGTLDTAVCRNKQMIERMTHKRSDGYDGYFLRTGHQYLGLIAEGKINLTCGGQLQGIVAVGRHLQHHFKSFLGKIPFFLSSIQKRMHSIRIPVQHDCHLVKLPAGIA
ncbi:hypothetical protein D3C80_1371300 [compost metagenome]